MKSLRSPRRARALSVSLACLLIAPYGAVGSRAAAAEPERSGLCVLDFNDVSRGGEAGLGRVAASRFAGQLGAGGVGGVTADQRVQEEARAQKLCAPFVRAGRARLAERLGAAQVVYGSITASRMVEKPAPHAYVRLTVLVEDARTGELVKSAVSEGTSAAKPGSPAARDAMFAEALTNAAASFAGYLASAGGTPGAASPAVACGAAPAAAPRANSPASEVAVVTQAQAKQLFANLSAAEPVVVDVPNAGGDGEVRGERRSLISDRTLKLLVGGALVMGLLYLAGTGGFGATRPF